MIHWKLVKDIAEAEKTVVFSGGASNIIDSQGKLVRNTERDLINKWLTEHDIYLFDPQIHPDTHGREYDYEIDHKMEVAARKHARIKIYEVSPRTFGGVTALEIAMDEFNLNQPTIIFFSDGTQQRDVIPAHDTDGYPQFVPYVVTDNPDVLQAHYRELGKNANRMRRYLTLFAQDIKTLTVTFDDTPREDDVVITPNRVHAADLFQAVLTAAGGERVNVNFIGGPAARDEKGNPLFLPPDTPRETDLYALLDQYIDEGNALRRAICQLVRINVFVRVVYTQRDVINALEDLMHIKGLR